MPKRETTVQFYARIQEEVDNRLETGDEDRWDVFEAVGNKFFRSPRTVKDIYYNKTVHQQHSE